MHGKNIRQKNAKSKQARHVERRFKRPPILLLIVWALAVTITALYVSNIANYRQELRSTLYEAEGNLHREQQANRAIAIQLEYFDSNEYIERLARERLGMVRPNETIFRNTAALE